MKIEDLCLAHRFLYYVLNQPVISDFEYDKLEKQALLVADEDHAIKEPGSDLEDSYSEEIKEIAYTLIR